MTPSDARAQALAESRFFGHLSAFAVVTAVLLGVNLVMGGAMWAAWVGVAWALIVASHAAAVFRHVLGGDWVERRAALLQVAPNYDALRHLELRLRALETAGPVSGRPAPDPDVLDPFDLGSANAVGRPVAPEWIGAAPEADVPDDPFAMSREPIDTPRLDGPAPRTRARSKPTA